VWIRYAIVDDRAKALVLRLLVGKQVSGHTLVVELAECEDKALALVLGDDAVTCADEAERRRLEVASNISFPGH